MSTEQSGFDSVQRDWAAREAAYNWLRDELLPINKAALFAVLRAAGIDSVTVSYDGSGDEGRIECVSAEADGQDVRMPGVLVELSHAHPDGSGTATRQISFPDAIADFAEDLVYRNYPWWEDGDGAYGEVNFDVTNGVISLEHNARYTAVNSFSREF